MDALSERALLIFGEIVDTFLDSGEPLGSRTLSKKLEQRVSPATIRNVMADLQDEGLIYAPHSSAGRLPTGRGLRLYVDTLMQENKLSRSEQQRFQKECYQAGLLPADLYARATRTLSDLSACAGLVLVPKREAPLRHIEFLMIEPGQALAVLVSEDGNVENRLIQIPPEITGGELQQASNFLKDRLFGRNLSEMSGLMKEAIDRSRAELDSLTAKVVEAGLAIRPKDTSDMLIFQGASNIMKDGLEQDMEGIQRLFALLEKQETATALLQQTAEGDGVQIFIGSENKVFCNDGLSMVISAYRDQEKRIVGATGVIGPTRLNYRKVVPMVDYTARLMSQLINTSR